MGQPEFSTCLEHVCVWFKAFLWWGLERLTLPTVKKHERAVQNQMSAEGVRGFNDSTMRPFYRLGENQEEHYSGHKKKYGF